MPIAVLVENSRPISTNDDGTTIQEFGARPINPIIFFKIKFWAFYSKLLQILLQKITYIIITSQDKKNPCK